MTEKPVEPRYDDADAFSNLKPKPKAKRRIIRSRFMDNAPDGGGQSPVVAQGHDGKWRPI